MSANMAAAGKRLTFLPRLNLLNDTLSSFSCALVRAAAAAEPPAGRSRSSIAHRITEGRRTSRVYMKRHSTSQASKADSADRWKNDV